MHAETCESACTARPAIRDKATRAAILGLDVDESELAAAPIRYEDGANDDWAHAPRETGYL